MRNYVNPGTGWNLTRYSLNSRILSEKVSRFPKNGFTLLELLVVLVIIGIIVSLTVISIDNRGEKHDQEARRLAAIIRLAAEEAVLSSREYKLQIFKDKYTFFYLDADKWAEVKDDEILRPRKLPDGFYFLVSIENEKVEWPDIEEENKGASIYLLSSGEITPFEIVIRDEYNLEARKNITNMLSGDVEVVGAGQKDRI